MSQGIAACSYVSLPGRLCGLGGIVRKQRNVSPAKSSALNPSMSKNRTYAVGENCDGPLCL